MIAEVKKVFRYPYFQNPHGLTHLDLLDCTRFFQSVAEMVVLDPQYPAPLMRDPNDVDVIQRSFCTLRGIGCER